MAPNERDAETATDRFVSITRVYDAPRELVFKAWTEPERLVRWYAPRGCTTLDCRVDLRVGGAFHYGIRNPEFGDCRCRGVYLEIVEPERIVFELGFDEEAGGPAVPPHIEAEADWPRKTVVTVEFAERDGKTVLTLHQTVRESIARRTGALPSWYQMLDRLAELLATPTAAATP